MLSSFSRRFGLWHFNKFVLLTCPYDTTILLNRRKKWHIKVTDFQDQDCVNKDLKAVSLCVLCVCLYVCKDFHCKVALEYCNVAGNDLLDAFCMCARSLRIFLPNVYSLIVIHKMICFINNVFVKETVNNSTCFLKLNVFCV